MSTVIRSVNQSWTGEVNLPWTVNVQKSNLPPVLPLTCLQATPSATIMAGHSTRQRDEDPTACGIKASGKFVGSFCFLWFPYAAKTFVHATYYCFQLQSCFARRLTCDTGNRRW